MAKIISISEAATIAIHVMVLIAQEGDKRINVGRLSDKTGASKNHIAKVMQSLVRFGFLKSTRGPSGGFVLRRPATEISLLQIYEALEGKMTVDDCPFDNRKCPFTTCLMNGIVHKLTDEIREYFRNQTLNDLAINSQ